MDEQEGTKRVLDARGTAAWLDLEGPRDAAGWAPRRRCEGGTVVAGSVVNGASTNACGCVVDVWCTTMTHHVMMLSIAVHAVVNGWSTDEEEDDEAAVVDLDDVRDLLYSPGRCNRMGTRTMSHLVCRR